MVLAQASSQGPSFSDLIWIIILLTAFQPAVQRYVLNMRRLRLLRRIERQRGTRVIALIHRQETMGLLGFPILRYLDIQDSEEVLRAIRLTPPEMPIDVILHTPGGLVLAADQIAGGALPPSRACECHGATLRHVRGHAGRHGRG